MFTITTIFLLNNNTKTKTITTDDLMIVIQITVNALRIGAVLVEVETDDGYFGAIADVETLADMVIELV